MSEVVEITVDELAAYDAMCGPTFSVSDEHSLAETGTLWQLLELLLTQTDLTLDDLRQVAVLGVGGVVDVQAGDAWVRVERIE